MIENLPLKTRKVILFSSVLVISVMILFLKFSFFAKPAADIKNEKMSEDLKKFGEEMGDIIQQTKSQFSEIKDRVGELTKIATSSPAQIENELNPAEIEKIKQGLDEKLKEKVATPTTTTD